MSNERLRAAIHQAGIEIDDLADTVEVDAKTVRRWLAGRTPRGLYRTRLAQALHTTEAELWPEQDLRLDGRDEKGEILAAYAHSGDLAAPDWRTLLQTATRQIDLLDLTLAHVLQASGTADLLTEKAKSGCEIRLLLSAPDSVHLALTDAEQNPDLALLDIPPSARQAEESLALAETLAATEAIQLRTFTAARFNTILRFDNEMLLTLHLYATTGEQAPVLHLRRNSDHGLFDRFTGHFDALWNDADQPNPGPSSPSSTD